MSALGSFVADVITFNAKVILEVAMHVPIFMQALLLFPYVPALDFDPPTPPTYLPHSAEQTATNVGAPELISPNCPQGTSTYLRQHNIIAQSGTTCTLISLPILSQGKPIQEISIYYGTSGGRGLGDDVILPLYTDGLLYPSGKIATSSGLYDMVTHFQYAAASKVANMLGASVSLTKNLRTQNLWETNAGSYANIDGVMEGPDTNGIYCALYTATSTVEGILEVCGKATDSNFEATGTIQVVNTNN